MVTSDRRAGERGVALVFALAALTLVAITLAAVVGELRSRGAGVVIEERAVRVTALSDASVAETLAGLAKYGSTYLGITERRFAGGYISSTVRPMGEWEAEVVAIGRDDNWQMTVRLRVTLQGGPRVVWWERTQHPISALPSDPTGDSDRPRPAPIPTIRMN